MEEITVIRRSSVAGVGSWDVRIDECAHGPGGKEIFVRFERGRWWSASVNRVPSERPRAKPPNGSNTIILHFTEHETTASLPPEDSVRARV